MKINELFNYSLFSINSAVFYFQQRNRFYKNSLIYSSLVGWDCRLRRQHLCGGVSTLHNEYPRYDCNPSNGEGPKLELWGILSTASLSSLSGQIWPGEVLSVRVISMGQKEQLELCINNRNHLTGQTLNGNMWNHLRLHTISFTFKNVTYKFLVY